MDAIHALDLLTEDCWTEVFKKVRSPLDLKSCSEACTTFEGILYGKRSVWMFPAILPHILPYLRSTPSTVPAGPYRRYLMMIRNWNPLYKCRLICRGWCQSMDHYLETHNNHFRGHQGPTCNKYSFRFGIRFEHFAEAFEDHPSNPFIGRFMRIDHVGMLIAPPQGEPNGDLEVETYIENVFRILSQFGTEIRSLSVQGIWSHAHLTCCKNIRILLGMLPNLKSLQLGDGVPLWRSIAQLEAWYEQDGINQLPAFLTANPFPDRPNLKHLALSCLSTRMGRPLLEKYGPQLTRLELYNPDAFVAKVQRFRCLKELEIWSFNPQDSLPALRQLQSPLEILHIHVRFHDSSKTWPIDELIRNILHLPVTELHISNQAYVERKLEAFPAPLQHATIRRVRITSYTGSSLSCNFLRCFPNLEEVHFKYSWRGIPQPGPENNLLRVSKDKENMYELPVWDVLHRLQIISVQPATCRRGLRKYRRSTFEMRRLEKSKEILASLF